MNTKYDVFISYSRRDLESKENSEVSESHVSRILQALQKAGISYWYDQEGIEYGDDFVEKILEHIESAPIFVFLSSKNSNVSRFTSREVAIADELRKYIIPVKLDSTPYGEKILFRIVDIQPIRYDKNRDRALKELLNIIHKHLDDIKKEEQKKEEEIRRKHEAEEAELLKEKNRRERKEQLVRLHEEHVNAKKVMETAENVVAECQSQLIKAKEALGAKEKLLKSEQSKLSELEGLLEDILQQKETTASAIDETNDKHKEQNVKDILTTATDVKEKNDHLKTEIISKQENDIISPEQVTINHNGSITYEEDSSKPLLNGTYKSILRKCSIGLLIIAGMFVIYKCLKQCSSEGGNLTNNSDVIVSLSPFSDINSRLNEILNNLRMIRPQLQEYIDGYQNNNAEATFKLAKCFEKGDFLEGNRNPDIAGKLCHIAADAGYADAQTSLGFYFFHGRSGYALNYDSAVYWYSEAIRNGSLDATYYLALAYGDGRYTGTKQGKKKTSKAIELYKSSAESGVARSQVVLGCYCYENGKYIESKKWLEEALNANNKLLDSEKAKAEFYMGQLYGTGKLTIDLRLTKEQAEDTAFKWYLKAATTGEGYTEAMYYLGIYFQDARGTNRDLSKAFEWYKKAAERNHKGAIEKLSGKS